MAKKGFILDDSELMDVYFKGGRKAGFDPNQARATDGQWTDSGSGPSISESSAKKQAKAHNDQPISMKGSTFTVDGKDMAGERAFAVSLFTDKTVLLDGPDITEKNILDYIEKNKDIFNAKGFTRTIGTWYNNDRTSDTYGKTFLDIAKIFTDREKAIKAGKDANQIAIFDLYIMDEIPTGGTGKARKAKNPKMKPGTRAYGEGITRLGQYMRKAKK